MEKLDVVYILGTGSRWRNNEIRYSIRSVEMNLLCAGRIFVIGECPDFLSGVIHIPYPDKHKNKQDNAREKYLVAANDERISDDFILMNDDFFVLEPVESVPNYTLGTMEEMIRRHPTKGGYYYQSMIDTKKVIESFGIHDPLSFEVHAPIVFNKEKLKTVIMMVGAEKAYSFRSCYGNIYAEENERVMDFKAAGLVEFIHQITRNSDYLSISDSLVAEREFRDWIRRTFPKPSRYENDRGEGQDILPGGPVGSMRYYAKTAFTYGSKRYSPGEIIENEHMDDIRNNPSMRDNWELK